MDKSKYNDAKTMGWWRMFGRCGLAGQDRSTREMLKKVWDEAFDSGYWLRAGADREHFVEPNEMVGDGNSTVKEAWDHSETAIAMALVALVLALAAIVVVIVNVLKGDL